MGIRRRLALLALAVCIAVLVVAVPAQAATVAKGSSNMTIGPTLTHSLVNSHITVEPVAPATEITKWNKAGQMFWWFRVPMKSGGNWNPATGAGTFFHSGSIRIVETSTSPQKIFRAEGIRIIATNKNTYTLSVTYPAGSSYLTDDLTSATYPRVDLATSTHAPKITHNGKAYKIDGVQFKLTQAGIDAIDAAIGVKMSKDVIFFDTDLLPVLK
jgi:hypothetical protein